MSSIMLFNFGTQNNNTQEDIPYRRIGHARLFEKKNVLRKTDLWVDAYCFKDENSKALFYKLRKRITIIGGKYTTTSATKKLMNMNRLGQIVKQI